MALHYTCPTCLQIVPEDSLLEDSMAEKLLNSKRCPSCGDKINLDEFDVEDVTEADIEKVDELYSANIRIDDSNTDEE